MRLLDSGVVESRIEDCLKLELSPIYTPFILGPALLKVVTQAVTFGSTRLIFCRVNAKFLARSPKELGEPGPPREVVLASLNSGPRAKKRFCVAFGH